MGRQLTRSKSNRVVAGVCGGFAEYFSIDPTIIRIICVVIALSGTGILAYIVAAIIMPDEGSARSAQSEWNTDSSFNNDDFARDVEKDKNEWDQPAKYNSEKNRAVIGAILVGLGILFLGRQLAPWFDLKYLVPLLLIGIGGFIIFRGRR